MMSNAQIAQMSQREGLKAAKKKLVPFRIENQLQIDVMGTEAPFPFPMIGDHRPDGYELIDEFMCDASGLGAESEPALTPRGLKARLQVGKAYAIIEAGQFQVVVGEFEEA